MDANIQKKINELCHHLKMKFRLPPNRPTRVELQAILKEIRTVPLGQRTEAKWREIVLKHVQFEGCYVYEGLDFSDLNALQSELMLLLE